jgi:quercetin 2,3-dioxygenase
MSNGQKELHEDALRSAGAGPGRLERIPARSAMVGDGLNVRRALPNHKRRMVGAWCFLDHAGPMEFYPGAGLSVGPHPHIGLQTFTWMIEGEVMHHDSLGNKQLIRPGQVNLMTAGRGISHAEISASAGPGRIHTTQLWIALPDAERSREPAFQHYPDLPILESGGYRITLLAGTAFGHTAPARVYSPLVGMDLASTGAAAVTVPLDPAFEHAVLCLSGAVGIAGEQLEPGTLLYLGTQRESVSVASGAASRLLLIGGEPFGEDVLLWWNFVGRTADEMRKATEDWQAHRHFGEVPEVILPRLVAPSLDGLQLKLAAHHESS